MAIRFRCQFCTGLMSISNRKAGMAVQCPTCGEQTLVPLEDIFETGPGFAPEESPPAPGQSARGQSTPGAFAQAPTEHDDEQEFLPTERESEQSHLAEIMFEPVRPTDELPSAAEWAHPREVDTITAGDVGDVRDAGSVDEPDREQREREDDEQEADAGPFQLRRRTRTDDDMDLTPMVDVTFQLLIFFMVTASFALQKTIQTPTPDPDKKGATQQLQILEDLEGSSIRVQIDAANKILIDDEPLADPARIADALKDKMRKEQKTELLITAHAAALHRSVISVIDAANDVGMQKIRLVSRQGKSE